MRIVAAMLFVAGLLSVTTLSSAQPPGGGKGDKDPAGKGGDKGGKGGFGGGDKGGKGGFGGGFGGGKGGFGGGGFGMPAPGQILAPFIQEQLKLTDAQKKELESMQKEFDAKLEKLLTEEQRKTFKEMKERGMRPGGPGGFPGGPGGAGGFPGFPGGPGAGGKGGNPPPPKPE